MDIFAEFATDETLETEGRWVPLSEEASVKVARTNNPKYKKLFLKRLKPHKAELEIEGSAANALAETIVTGVMAETILLDWKGIKYKGQELPYSKENALMLLKLKDFRDKISALADQFEGFKQKQEEEAKKDLSFT